MATLLGALLPQWLREHPSQLVFIIAGHNYAPQSSKLGGCFSSPHPARAGLETPPTCLHFLQHSWEGKMRAASGEWDAWESSCLEGVPWSGTCCRVSTGLFMANGCLKGRGWHHTVVRDVEGLAVRTSICLCGSHQ